MSAQQLSDTLSVPWSSLVTADLFPAEIAAGDKVYAAAETLAKVSVSLTSFVLACNSN
jgi:hypothetical protein